MDPFETTCELHSRASDGIEVQMLWSRVDGRVEVFVFDTRSGDSFTIEVHGGERALEVFHHPFAYAAQHEITVTSDAFESAGLATA